MFTKVLRLAALGVCASLLTGFAAGRAAADDNGSANKEIIRIGLVNSLFRDMPPLMVQVIMEPFSALMEAQTGLKGQLVTAGDALDLSERLKSNKVQLAVFHGVEFGWAQQKYPDLKPLMLAVNQRQQLHAYVMVRDDSQAASFADLRNRTVAVPRRSREHCHLFLHRCCREHGTDAKRFFTQITTPPGVESALDDVLRGKVQASVVDSVGLESYKHEKPACFARLKVLKVSEAFPAAVVAYNPGVLDDATLLKFKDGMARAHETAIGRQLLGSCRLTGFEPVPADYQKMVDQIIKAYPAPTPVIKLAATQNGK